MYYYIFLFYIIVKFLKKTQDIYSSFSLNDSYNFNNTLKKIKSIIKN